ncbi:hypothetical protein F5884DRAFT_756520 [Xylogone sp. PMI_703]|nr:hypothetical protein F5884DRAFT_756520 [Xylogone sp. PMI_703]
MFRYSIRPLRQLGVNVKGAVRSSKVQFPQFPRRTYAEISEVTNVPADTSSSEGNRQPKTKTYRPFKLSSFHPVWLRDACTCPRCVDPSSKQKNFQTAEIPEKISIQKEETLPNGDVKITWSKDIPSWGPDHTTTIPHSFLRTHSTRALINIDRSQQQVGQFWDAEKISNKLQYVDYHDYLTNDETLYTALFQLRSHGLLLVRGVPESEKAVEEITGRIGTLRDTFYGRTWDVKSVPKAKNVAYTSQFLGLHMDLCYMVNPPGFQFLHCLRNTCEGGASLFSDSFQAANSLTAEHFTNLCTSYTAFHYRNAGEHYYQYHKVIDLASRYPLEIKYVNWSPPFQAPYPLTPAMQKSGFSEHLEAIREFRSRIESPENLFEYRLQEGECVIFNNRRVLHGRREFDTETGERWLKGAYVDTDVFMSKFRVLNERYGEERKKINEKAKYVNYDESRGGTA